MITSILEVVLPCTWDICLIYVRNCCYIDVMDPLAAFNGRDSGRLIPTTGTVLVHLIRTLLWQRFEAIGILPTQFISHTFWNLNNNIKWNVVHCVLMRMHH